MNNEVLKLVSPIPPSVNHYLAYRVVKKGSKYMAMSYKTKDAINYMKYFIPYVKDQVKKQGWIMDNNKSQHYYLDCVFYFDRADRDANNYFKLSLDSITQAECVWIDDTQVCERVQGIFYDNKNPRIEMTLKRVDYIGIFKDNSQLENFKSNCIGCSRYKRNCSILNKALQGKICEEINDEYICNKLKKVKGE